MDGLNVMIESFESFAACPVTDSRSGTTLPRFEDIFFPAFDQARANSDCLYIRMPSPGV